MNEKTNLSLRRDKFEIISAIIAVTQQPSTLSHLMYQVNLSSTSLKQYLKLMLKSRLISEQTKGIKKHNHTAYFATEKGNRFLQLYCANLLLLHGEHFIEKNRSLKDAYLLRYCMKNKATLNSKLRSNTATFNREIEETLKT